MSTAFKYRNFISYATNDGVIGSICSSQYVILGREKEIELIPISAVTSDQKRPKSTFIDLKKNVFDAKYTNEKLLSIYSGDAVDLVVLLSNRAIYAAIAKSCLMKFKKIFEYSYDSQERVLFPGSAIPTKNSEAVLRKGDSWSFIRKLSHEVGAFCNFIHFSPSGIKNGHVVLLQQDFHEYDAISVHSHLTFPIPSEIIECLHSYGFTMDSEMISLAFLSSSHKSRHNIQYYIKKMRILLKPFEYFRGKPKNTDIVPLDPKSVPIHIVPATIPLDFIPPSTKWLLSSSFCSHPASSFLDSLSWRILVSWLGEDCEGTEMVSFVECCTSCLGEEKLFLSISNEEKEEDEREFEDEEEEEEE
ncbi:hypothetical protein ADUPG1_007127, partial [Aduncisulcus paluster]